MDYELYMNALAVKDVLVLCAACRIRGMCCYGRCCQSQGTAGFFKEEIGAIYSRIRE